MQWILNFLMERVYASTYYWSLSQSVKVSVNNLEEISVGFLTFRSLNIRSESICHFSTFPKAKKTIQVNKNDYSSILELLFFFDPYNCPIYLSSSLNLFFISFLSVKFDGWLLKIHSLKPLSGMTLFFFHYSCVTELECRVDILLDPHCNFQVISLLSSFQNPDFFEAQVI